MEHVLLFKNPELQPGLNVTVRNGEKWMQANPLIDTVSIRDTANDQVEIAKGYVVGTFHMEADNIPNQILQYEHDASCRTREGLKVAMDRAYPDGWGPYVTIVLFTVLQEEDGKE